MSMKLTLKKWKKTLKTILTITVICIATACSTTLRTTDLEGLYMCPHDPRAVRAAAGFVDNVFLVDGYYMSVSCVGSFGYTLLGCTRNGETTDIYILYSLSKQAREETYYHELCHVYESYVLNFAGTGTHEGWAINPVFKEYYEEGMLR